MTASQSADSPPEDDDRTGEAEETNRLRTWGSWILRLLVSTGSIILVLQFVPLRDRVQINPVDAVENGAVDKLYGTVTNVDRARKKLHVRTDERTRAIPFDRIERIDGQLFVPGLIGTWHRIDLTFALPAFLLLPFLHLIGAYRWKRLLAAQNVRIPYRRSVQITFIGYFWNNFSLGLTGGDVAKAYLIGSRLERKAGGVLSVLVDRAIGLIALLSLAGVASLFRPGVRAIRRVGLLVFILLLLLFVGLYLFFHPSFRRQKWVVWIRRRLPFQNIIRATDRAARQFKKQPTALVQAFLLSLLIHGGAILMCLLFGHALGITKADLIDYGVYYPIATAVSALPISASGWGIGEASYVFLFGLAGVASATALSLSLLVRLTMVLWSLPGGLLMIVPVGKNIRRTSPLEEG